MGIEGLGKGQEGATLAVEHLLDPGRINTCVVLDPSRSRPSLLKCGWFGQFLAWAFVVLGGVPQEQGSRPRDGERFQERLAGLARCVWQRAQVFRPRTRRHQGGPCPHHWVPPEKQPHRSAEGLGW